MGTITEKLQEIINTKASIKQALVQGRNPSNVFSTYADEILNIQTGMPNLCGTLTVGGTYVNNVNQSGSKMGNNENGDVFLIMQGELTYDMFSQPQVVSPLQPTSTHAEIILPGCLGRYSKKKINICRRILCHI